MVSTSKCVPKHSVCSWRQQANATVFQTLFDLLDPKNDIVPGTGKPLGQWRYGVDPMPTINPPSSQLNPGSTGRLMERQLSQSCHGGVQWRYSWALNANTAFEVEYTHVLGLHGNQDHQTSIRECR